jgi:iron(III) transport system substrate-binding protein
MTRLVNEGRLSPADVFITVDAGNLWRADQQGLFKPVQSAVLESRIPENLRHPQGHWFGFTKRVRVIAASKARVPEGAVASYEDLADPKWKGRVCIRSSSNVYNLSLMGALIERLGEKGAKRWAKRVVANFARQPQGGDTDQIKAVAAGVCDLALVNHYYYVRLLTSKDQAEREAAEAVRLVFPNQATTGAHVNISGAGVAAYAPHPNNAVLFLEYLASDEAQEIFAQGNNEFPAVAADLKNPALKALGPFKEDSLSVAVYGENQPEAQKIFDDAGWQ